MLSNTDSFDFNNDRAHRRHRTSLKGVLEFSEGVVPVRINNLSMGGAGLVLGPSANLLSDVARLRIEGALSIPLRIQWRAATLAGGTFELKAPLDSKLHRLLSLLSQGEFTYGVTTPSTPMNFADHDGDMLQFR